MKMNRTVKVTGFSLKRNILSQIQEHFERVAQVDRVYLAPDKNSAFVQLAWESSVSFVVGLALKERWDINGEQVYVKPESPTYSPKDPASPLNRAAVKKENNVVLPKQSIHTSYQDYRDGQSQFYKDVPHHTFSQVLTGRTNKKRKWSSSLHATGSVVSVPSSEVKRKCRPNRKKRKSKKCPVLVPAKSFEFGVYNQNQVFIQSPQLPPETMNQLYSGEHEQPLQDTGSHEFLQEKPRIQQHQPKWGLVQCTQPSPNSTQRGSEQHPSVVDVFIKADRTTTLSLCRPASAAEVHKSVSEVLKMPAELLHITAEGHTLTDVAIGLLQSGSTLHCTIKGKGGMEEPSQSQAQGAGTVKLKAAEKGENETIRSAEDKPLKTESAEEGGSLPGPTDDFSVLSTSSEEEVGTWLQRVCHLTADEIQEFEGIDGDTLFAYQYSELKKFMKHTGISLGKARKILYFRDNPGVHNIISCWSVADVAAFVAKLAKNKEDVVCFEEHEIDGPALLSFENDEDVEKDLGLHGRLAFQIIVKRDKLLKDAGTGTEADPQIQQHSTEQEKQKKLSSSLFADANDTDDTQALEKHQPEGNAQRSRKDPLLTEPLQVRDDLSGDVKESALTKSQIPLDDRPFPIPKDQQEEPLVVRLEANDPFASLKLFVQNALHLQHAELPQDRDTRTDCDLRVIYLKQKKLNELEKCFVFIIVCKNDFCRRKEDKAAVSKLWEAVISRVHSHFIEELPQDVRCKFKVQEESSNIYYGETQVSFEKTPNSAPKLSSLSEYERNVGKLDNYSTPILLVDRRIFRENCQGYVFNMGSKNKPVFYCFRFDHSRQYWLFDSEDFGTFQYSTIPTCVAGRSSRCKLEMIVSSEGKSSRSSPEPLGISIAGDSAGTNALEPSLCSCNTGSDSDTQKLNSQEKDGLPSMPVLPRSHNSQEDLKPMGSVADQLLRAASSTPESLSQGLQYLKKDSMKRITPRRFKRKLQNNMHFPVCYEHGRLLDVVESQDGMIAPSIELKLHAKNDLSAFLRKSLKFVSACLNSRKNGTIYFGVADNGEISGVDLGSSDLQNYSETFRTYLEECLWVKERNTGADKCRDRKEILMILNECVLGPHFVPTTLPQRFVIEVDIEPSADFTKEFIFLFGPESLYDRFGGLSKKDKMAEGYEIKHKGPFACVRRMEGGKVATCVMGADELKDFERYHLEELVKRRQKEEEEWKLQFQVKHTKEADKLKKFLKQYDVPYYPVLIVSKPADVDRQALEKCLKFVAHIGTIAIFDFDSCSDKDGLYQYVISKTTCDVSELTVDKFEFKSAEECRKKLSLSEGKKTIWLFCNGTYASGNHPSECLEYAKWRKAYFPYVKNVVRFLQHPSVVPQSRHLVLVLVSSEAKEDVFDTADDFLTTSNIGSDRVFYVFDHHDTKEAASQLMKTNDISHAILPWTDVQNVVMEVFDLAHRGQSKEVASASGASSFIPPEVWQYWNNLSILNKTECEEFDQSQPAWEQKAEEVRLNFYKGGEVTWLNFYLPSQVMERADLREMERKIRQLAEKSDGNQIPRVTIGHMPGSGGTTVGKHLLWLLRKDFKCAVIDNLSNATEDQIYQFWAAEERLDTTHLNPVIVLLDNVANEESELDAPELCKRLSVRQAKLQLPRPLAVVIICQQSVEQKNAFDFFLRQKIQDKAEKVWLRNTCEEPEIKEMMDSPGEIYFWGILSLRKNFEIKALQHMIVPYLQHGDLHSSEKLLIVFVALIMVYFPASQGHFKGLPLEICEQYLLANRQENTFSVFPCTWEEKLSTIAKMFFVKEDKGTCTTVTSHLKLTNHACAQAVLNAVTALTAEDTHKNLSDIVTNFLNSALVTDLKEFELHAKPWAENVFRKMLTERQGHADERKGRSLMSPLIEHVMGQSGLEEAAGILLLGHERLGGGVFYQQLARLYKHYEQFDDAVAYALQAVDSDGNVGDFKHTAGSVYLTKFKKESTGKDGSDAVQLLDIAKAALDMFQNAFEDFQKEDDAIGLSYALGDTMETVNLVFKYMIQCVLFAPEEKHEFGRFLVDPHFQFELPEQYPKDLKDMLQTLMKRGVECLEFLYLLAHSYRSTGQINSVKAARNEYALSLTKTRSVKQHKAFVENVRNLVSSSSFTDVPNTTEEVYRCENLKLRGTVFESIMYYVFEHNRPGKKGRGSNLKDLVKIRDNFNKMDEKKMLPSDKDNFISVCLALELLGQKTEFSSDQGKIHRFCVQVMNKDSHPVRVMRAHLYRILVVWPTQKPAPRLNSADFEISFHHKPTFLQSKDGNLSPRVHFFVARITKDWRFHLCHWTDIYQTDEPADSMTDTMYQRLEPFKGVLHVFHDDPEKGNRHNRGALSTRRRPRYQIKFDLQGISQPLTIRGVRNADMCGGGPVEVEFYIGFSIQGAVAYIFRWNKL